MTQRVDAHLSRGVRFVVVLVVVAAVLGGFVRAGVSPGVSTDDLLFAAFGLLFLGVGVLLFVRAGANRVSWVMLAIAFGVGLMAMAEPVLDGTVATLLNGVGLFAFVLPGVTVFLPLWFPTGRPPSSGWRWVGPLAVVGVGLLVAGRVTVALTRSGDLDVIEGCSSVGSCLSSVGLAALLCAGLAAVLSFGFRWARSRGAERLQLRWLVPALLALAVGVVAEFGGFQDSLVASLFLAVGSLLVPLAIAVAILRYRLYEIDRIVSRSLTYALLASMVVVLYAAIAIGLPRVLPLPLDSPLLVAATTLAAAALFNPARRRIQAGVDRRFNRARYDAQREMDSFSVRLRGEQRLTDLAGDMLTVVVRTMEPASASLWLAEHGGDR